ncbi:MAG: hypothetical protein K1X67_11185 [Fimbriimonadaceae bacterium]|nr:hypothetical protein [Fimbriimonadaceae bacterium]
MESLAPSLFESYNARGLGPAEIAATFVPPPQFDTLTGRNHSVLLGPRGSGKTTLLRMLDPEALAQWHHPRADTFRRRIAFSGVFVSADPNWTSQREALVWADISDEHRSLIESASFSAHVLRAVVDTLEYVSGRAHAATPPPARAVSLDGDTEATFVRTVSEIWRTRPSVASLPALRQSLRQRLSHIQELVRRERLLPPAGRVDRLAAAPFLYVDALTAATSALELFDELASNYRGGAHWALLFDELELAPREIRRQLFGALRAPTRGLLLKLAISPYSEDFSIMAEAQGAKGGHDFDEIPLWYSQKQGGYTFCEKLWEARVAPIEGAPRTPQSLLGKSLLDEQREDASALRRGYRRGGTVQRAFESLAGRDPSFSRYLANTGIDVRSLDSVASTKRAASVRKVVNLVLTRESFLSDRDSEGATGGAKIRSRKTSRLYSGVPAIYAMSEGNPRSFLGITRTLLDTWRRDGAAGPVSPAVQGEAVLQATHRFAALLSAVRVSVPPGTTRPPGLLQLLDRVGKYIFDRTVRDAFTDDPCGSFFVDSGVDDWTAALVGKALNAGAIVYVPGQRDSGILRSVSGKRFRLSYLLAPRYGLPLRLGRPVSLATMLGDSWGRGEGQTQLPFMQRTHDE